MSNAFRAQRVQSAPHAGWSRAFARVRRTVQALGECFLEPGRELFRGKVGLVSCQSQRYDAIAHTLNGKSRSEVRTLLSLRLLFDVTHNVEYPTHLHAKILACPLAPSIQSAKIDILVNAQGKTMRADRKSYLRVAHMLASHLLAKFI